MGCNVEPGTNGGPEQVDISPFVSTDYTYILHNVKLFPTCYPVPLFVYAFFLIDLWLIDHHSASLLSLYQHECPLILGSDFHTVSHCKVLAVIAQASHRLRHTLQHMCCQQW